MFKYTFWITTTSLESLRSQKTLQRLDLGKTYYKHLDLAPSEFLRFVASPNESLRFIITYYMFKHILDQVNYARVTSDPKKPFNGSISAELVIMTLFYRQMDFNTSCSFK